MANQIIIDIGAVANDGTGDPLRTAFNYVNNNFSNVWATGVANSNIQFDGNRILTTNTNGNLVLAPNGIGKVQSNVDIVPNANNTVSLGSLTRQWNTVYARNLTVGGDTTFNNLTVSGNLTVQGNTIQIGNIVTDTKTIQLANTAATANAANGSGITVGANDNIATMLYSSTSNTWVMNIGANITGNVTAPYFFGNGSQLTGLPVQYGNANVVTLLAGFGSNTISTTGNITGGFIFGNISQANGFPATYGNSNVTTLLSNLGSNIISGTGNITTTGNITGGFILGNVRFANGLPATYSNANAVAYGESGWAGNIIPSGNAVYSLGNSTNQWNDLYVSNTTIFMNNVPLSLTAGNVLTVNGNAVLQNNSNTTISTTGNVTSGNLISPTLNNSGNISVVASGNSWLFGSTGNLVLPRGGVVYETSIPSGGLDGNTIALKPSGGTNPNQQLLIYPTGGADDNHLHLTTGNLYNTELFLGNDNLYVKLANTGNVVINSNDDTGNSAQWTFGTTGTTIFPTLTVTRGDRTGSLTGQALVFGDSTQEALISTPNGTNAIADSQRIVINPGAGYANTTGEGGDIYLYAGRGGDAGGTGGDIKIRGGLGPMDGAGGYLDIMGGEAAGNGVGGRIDIQGGESGNSNGGDINITGGQGRNGGDINILGGTGTAGPGGDLTLQGGVSSNGLAAYGNVVVNAGASQWQFDNTGNLRLPSNTFAVNYANGTAVALGGSYGNANVATFLTAYGSNTITTTGNITGGNLISSTGIVGNIELIMGNVANASATRTRILSDGAFSYIQTGNGTAGTTGNIVFSPYQSPTQRVVINTASGNITATGNVTAQNFTGNISITGNVQGTTANVTLVAGSYSTVFDNTGNLTLPGNTFAVNYANNTPVDVVTRFESFWTVPVGNSTQSFTVSASNTYYMWVDCSIPNGILTWNATGTVTNTNVPVVGAQYAWVYTGGGTPIDFTSIPDQFVGTANTIVRSNVAPSATTNRFDFGINNASGNAVTVRYGWIQIS